MATDGKDNTPEMSLLSDINLALLEPVDFSQMKPIELPTKNPDLDPLDELPEPLTLKKMFSNIVAGYSSSSGAIQMCPSADPEADKKKLNENAACLRSKYLEIFQLQENVYDNDQQPNWWIDVFRDSGDIMVEKLKQELKLPEPQEPVNDNWEITVKYGEVTQKFNKDKRVFLIGRRQGCDIWLPQNASRLHAIVYLIPELKMTLVVDVGSLVGIVTDKRGSDKPCVSSLPESRKIIVLDWCEFASLKFCAHEIVMCP